MKNKNMDNENRLAQIAGNPDETQIVSLKDLEELEYLQLTGSDTTVLEKSRRAVPLGLALGLLAALCLAAVLAALYLHHGAQPAAVPPIPQGGR